MQEKIERLSIEEIMEHCNRTCEKMELFAASKGKMQDEIADKTYWEHYQVKNYLEELSQYRAIGAVEKVREYKEISDNIDAVSMDKLCICMNKMKEYQNIGTPEECREAVEKQKAKRCNLIGDGYADGKMVYDTYECPNCGKQYEVEYDEFNYCPECGQKLEEIIYEL